jgi:hypothetical protein
MEGSVKMSEKVNAGDHPKNDSAQQRRLYEQFEFAKQIYAAHRLLVNVPPLDGQKIGAFIHERLAGFTAAGGEARIGINSQGEEGPDLRNENGGILNYDIGEGLAQQYISARIFL